MWSGNRWPHVQSRLFFSQKFSPRFAVFFIAFVMSFAFGLDVLACINLICVSCKIWERLSQKNYGLDQMSAVILSRWSCPRVQINKPALHLLPFILITATGELKSPKGWLIFFKKKVTFWWINQTLSEEDFIIGKSFKAKYAYREIES